MRIIDWTGTPARRAFWLANLANVFVSIVLNDVVGVIVHGKGGQLIIFI